MIQTVFDTLAMKKSTPSVQLVTWDVKSVDGLFLNTGFSSGK